MAGGRGDAWRAAGRGRVEGAVVVVVARMVKGPAFHFSRKHNGASCTTYQFKIRSLNAADEYREEVCVYIYIYRHICTETYTSKTTTL